MHVGNKFKREGKKGKLFSRKKKKRQLANVEEIIEIINYHFTITIVITII